MAKKKLSDLEHHRRVCSKKVAHDTETTAIAHKTRLRRTTGGFFVIYKCLACGKYHVAHATKRVKQSIIDRSGGKVRRSRSNRRR